jgi:O-antigen ligase
LKWAVLLLCLIIVPVMGAMLRRSPKMLPWAAFAMAFLPFVMNQWKLSFAPVAWPGWPGWPKGIEFNVLDFLAVAVLLAVPKRPGLKPLVPWLLYLSAVLVTVPLAGQKMPAMFYVWQLTRMMIIFLAVILLARAPKAGEKLLQGVVVGIVYNLFFAVMQFLQGDPQPGGAIGHQNMLGLVANFALVPCLTLWLVGRQTFWAVVGVGAALLLDFLTASRATLALAGVGIGVALFISCLKNLTGRKAAISGAFLLLCAVGGPLAWHSLMERRISSQNGVESSDTQRDAMKRAAWMVISDHPFGIGADQYVIVANLQGYSARAGVAWNPGARGSSVHDSYLLVLAETGLLGLVTMLFLLLSPAFRGIRTAFRYRRDPRSELLLGFSVAILVFAGHLMFEWAWVMAEPQYMFAMYAGVVVALVSQLRTDALPKRGSASISHSFIIPAGGHASSAPSASGLGSSRF